MTSGFVGCTERGDAGLDLSWSSKMDTVAFAILITKSVNDAFIDEVLKHRNKIILHATVTGYGSSILEPNVNNFIWSYEQIMKLITLGFPAKQIVLRIDPIIITEKGLAIVEKILNVFSNTKIDRVRYSFMDLYPHVIKRFENANIHIPQFNVQPINRTAMSNFNRMIAFYTYDFESCAENTNHQVGCISKKDVDILNIQLDLKGSSGQRKGCLCPSVKKELLCNAKQCANGCLYCYWK